MRVVEATQNFEFSLDLFKDPVLADLLFVEDFDGDFVASLVVESHLYFSERAIAQVLGKAVLPYLYFVH